MEMPSSPPRFRSLDEELPLLRERPEEPLEELDPRERSTLPDEELPLRCGLVRDVERGGVARRRSTVPRVVDPVRIRLLSTLPRVVGTYPLLVRTVPRLTPSVKVPTPMPRNRVRVSPADVPRLTSRFWRELVTLPLCTPDCLGPR